MRRMQGYGEGRKQRQRDTSNADTMFQETKIQQLINLILLNRKIIRVVDTDEVRGITVTRQVLQGISKALFLLLWKHRSALTRAPGTPSFHPLAP